MKGIELGGALLMGVMGSVHCVAMCGPIGAVLCSGGKSRGRLLPHAGRLLTYVALGTLAGLIGSAVKSQLPFAVLQLGARVAAAIVLIAVGFYTAGFFRRFGVIERLTAPLFRRAAQVLPARGARSIAGRMIEGVVWGLLPCGLVYGALGLATVAASPADGALVMLAFGAGTLPAMITVSIFAERFRQVARHPRIRQTAGLLLAVAGTVHLALAIQWAGGLASAARTPHLNGAFAPVIERPCCHGH